MRKHGKGMIGVLFNNNRKIKLFGLIAIMTVSFFLAGCDGLIQEDRLMTDGGLQRFSSEEEINSLLSRASGDTETDMLRTGAEMVAAEDGAVARDIQDVPDTSAPDASEGAPVADDGSGHSETNIQVPGVDEADIVKTDGDHIYYVSNNKVFIISVSDGEMEKLSEISDDDKNIADIFIDDDRLVVMGNTRYRYDAPDMPMPSVPGGYLRMPYYPYETKMFISVYDISDRSEPELIEDIEADGRYTSSRMIDGKVYVISDKRMGDMFLPPVILHGGREIVVEASDIYHADTEESSYDLSLVLEIDVDDGSLEKLPILKGSTNNIFVSENNIYITGRKNVPFIYEQRRIVDDVYREMLPRDIVARIDEIDGYDIREHTKVSEINHVVYEHISTLDQDEAKRLLERMESEISRIRDEVRDKRDHTLIHRISIGDGMVYEASGKVRGHVNDQFSMDEHDGHFRIATTSGSFWDRDNPSKNNVYVLDMDLDIVGELEGLAPEERIHSVRFMGETMHMVTFRTVDPLFSIDLSDPSDPRVEGELKIPGYSDYLHPIGDDLMIGLGRDVIELRDDRTFTAGIKLSLFDVSDMSSPEELSTYVIGGRGSQTPALHDHRAFLYDRGRGLLILPVSENEKTELDDRNGREFLPFGDLVFQGAYVFKVNPEDGFELKGKVSHLAEDALEGTASRVYHASIVRSLLINEKLYTLSRDKLMSHDIIDFAEMGRLVLDDRDDNSDVEEPVPYGRDVSIDGAGLEGVEPSEAIAEPEMG